MGDLRDEIARLAAEEAATVEGAEARSEEWSRVAKEFVQLMQSNNVRPVTIYRRIETVVADHSHTRVLGIGKVVMHPRTVRTTFDAACLGWPMHWFDTDGSRTYREAALVDGNVIEVSLGRFTPGDTTRAMGYQSRTKVGKYSYERLIREIFERDEAMQMPDSTGEVRYLQTFDERPSSNVPEASSVARCAKELIQIGVVLRR